MYRPLFSSFIPNENPLNLFKLTLSWKKIRGRYPRSKYEFIMIMRLRKQEKKNLST